MIEDIKFTTLDETGIEKTFIVLEKFSKLGKNYIIYQEENKEDLYASLYEINENNIKLIPIESDSDYDIVDEYLENL